MNSQDSSPNLFLNFYFRFVFDWFTRFYAVNIIENIDTQSSSWSESLKIATPADTITCFRIMAIYLDSV